MTTASPVADHTTVAPRLQFLQQQLAPLYTRLANHPLYTSFRSLAHVRLFMQSHVFAVWDFMSLLKALQRGLTSIDVPWRPTHDPATRRFINEIVLGEESDVHEGRPLSHFELYLEAMRNCGADTHPIQSTLASLAAGKPLSEALEPAPAAAQTFVAETFRFLATGQLHIIAAAFTFGREDLIPDLFRGFLRDQDARLNGQLSLFRWYLDRHIEVDGDEHGPLSLAMIQNLCGHDERKWREAAAAATQALNARIDLWDAVTAELT